MPDKKDRSVEETLDGGSQIVEISNATLERLLKQSELKIGKNVRVVKALEIQPGAIIARQYDR
jgi:hypothetical protein